MLVEAAVDSFWERRRSLIPPGFDQETIDSNLKKRLAGIQAVFGGNSLEGAIFNQNFSYDLYQNMIEVEEKGEDSLKRQEIEMFVELLEHLSGERTNEGKKFRQVLCGAKAQAGLMFALRKNKFWVISPRTEEEVKKMDLRGVDFAAVNSLGVLFLIEVKSLYKIQGKDGQLIENLNVVFQPNSLKARTIAETLSLISRRGEHPYQEALFSKGIKYVAFRISVPTGRSSMDRYGRIFPEVEKLILDGFNQVKPQNWTG